MSSTVGNLAFFSLGSNIDPTIHLPAAVRLLSVRGKLRGLSQAWQSSPFGFAEQDDFVNAAVLLETDLEAAEIIEEVIPYVERQLGRQRDPSNKNGPRTIDVDLSLYNGEVGEPAGKVIPDPAILDRLFVAWPLAEVCPDYDHPLVGVTLRQIADRLASSQPELRLRADIVLHATGQPPEGRRTVALKRAVGEREE